MTLIAGNHIGRVHHAAAQHDLQRTRPTYAFVPEDYFTEQGFQKTRYLASTWPSINAGANPNAIGSHVLPDVTKPVASRSTCPVLAEFLARLQTLAAIATNQQ